MTEGRDELPYETLIRMLTERYPDKVAELLRELGYHVEEPAEPVEPPTTELDEEQTESVLHLALDLLEQSGVDAVDVELPGELWMGEATDEVLGVHMGQQVLSNVHTPDKCAGRPCVLHNPSEHHMRQWPLLWRGDLRIMERRCPHGIGHPDPDDVAYQESIGRENGVHGCDGCCRSSLSPTSRA